MTPLPPVDRRLRRDVRFLGRLLGQVLRSREGEAFYALEEKVRRLAIRRRRGPKALRADAMRDLSRLLSSLPTASMEPLIRAFSIYFQLVNLAEQNHRVRRARAYASQKGAPPQRGSLAAAMLAARAAGIPAERARASAQSLEVTLALTAHPSQATRRTVLDKLTRISQLLEDRDRTRLTVAEREGIESAIQREIVALWQTDELRRERPTVGDEVKNVSYYVEEVLFDCVPRVSRELQRAFQNAYGEPLGGPSPVIRLHSWVGGDMDGNPLVTPEVFTDALRAYQARGLRAIAARLAALGRSSSISSRRVTVPPELEASLARDAERAPEVAKRQGPRTEGEPWRRKLRFVEARLVSTLHAVEARRKAAADRAETLMPGETRGAAPPYADATELEADLALVARTLRQVDGGDVEEAEDLLVQVQSSGFHLAELELRAPAEDARSAAAALAAKTEPSGDGARFFAALRAIAQGQAEGGERACRTLILSMALTADDVVAAFACAQAAGLADPRGGARIDIVPLFETLEALQQSESVMRSLFARADYAAHLRVRGVQEVMVGYSDSNKQVGPLAAKAAILRAQEKLRALAAEARIPLRLFHGRGESVARGGGPAQQAILALPPGTVGGRYKATEQGEALDHKYARPALAMRTLELTTGGALLHTLDAEPRAPKEKAGRFLEAMEKLAEIGRRSYRALVWEEPRFAELFQAMAPIDEISQLPIGSRPAKRKSGGVESLRAIPWVFAWTQNRAILPGWYGTGAALEALADTRDGRRVLREMYKEWPSFRTLVDAIEMVLAKTDLRIAEGYAALAAPDLRPLWEQIRAEHKRSVRWVKWLTGRARLLEGNPSLRRSISLRNPYVDPLSLLQVQLLERKRAGATDCDRPLLLTLSGIAAGMRNTG